MEVLKTAVLSTGLVAGFLAAFLIALYCLQFILRVVRHWDTSRPLPEVQSWKVGALQVTLAESKAARKVKATLARHHERLEAVDRMLIILNRRVRHFERRAQ
ncbi:MAG: hypothetical protein HYW06_06440 [Gemmatimonadetes bacterium]|nr:hypothetical protein [Gemmatimonadota bacterium]MBI2536593.1 hypothetical protein [Gemmatimonadota bacterium]